MGTTNTFDIITQQRAEPQPTVSSKDKPNDEAVFSQETYERLKSSSQSWRDQMIEDNDFYLAAQISQKQDGVNKKRKRKSFSIDVIYQAVEQAIALLTSNRPRFSCTGAEDSDTRIAAVYASIMQYLWKFNNATQKLKQTIKDYYVGSVGWFHMYWDPYALNGKGEIRLDTVDPKRVFVEENSHDFFWNDADHIIIETFLTSEMMQTEYNMTLEEVEQFETQQESLQSSTRVSEIGSGSANLTPTQKDTYCRLDRYSRVKEFMYVLSKDDERFEMVVDPRQLIERTRSMICIVARTSKATNYFCAPRNVANISKLLSQYGEVFHEVTIVQSDGSQQTSMMSGMENQVDYPQGVTAVPGSTVQLSLVSMYDAIRSGKVKAERKLLTRIKHVASIGTKLLFTDILPTEHHALIPLINNFDRTIFPVGDVRRVKREQEFINSIRQIVVTHANLVTNFKIAYPEGLQQEAKLDEIFNDPMKRFLSYPSELQSSGMQIIAPPPLPNQLYLLEQQARKNIEERMGIFSIMSGNPTDAPNTYKATVTLDEYGQRRIKSKKDDIEEFLNQIGRVVVDFIQYYYTESRVIHIVSPNDKPVSINLRSDSRLDDLYQDNEYRINDLTVGRYDLVVISGSTLPSNRFAMLELYTELYKVGLLDQETVLQKTEVANVEEVMSRISRIKQLEEMVMQLQGQIKKLSGDLQTADREVIHAKRDKEMTVFQKNLETEEVKATAARMIYETTFKNMKRVATE